MNKVWKFFCSVKLTVVLFVLILIPSVIGTFIKQNAPDPRLYVEIYGPFWNSVFGFLGFYDIYHDPRFIILLVMLALNTFACTVNRFRPKWSMIGMLMTHAGLLMILLGAVTGAALGVKGYMQISEGDTLDKIEVMRADEHVSEPIPFKVHLVDFIVDMQPEPIHKLLVLDVKTKEQQSFHVEEGKPIALSQPRWAGLMSLLGITLDGGTRLVPRRFLVFSTWLSDGPVQTGMRAVEVRLRGDGVEHHGATASGASAPYTPQGTHTGIYYHTLDSADDIEPALQEAVASTRTINQIEVVTPGAPLTSAHSAQVGATFEVQGHTVEVLRYEPDFVSEPGKQVTSRSKFPHNPAIRVRITSPEGAPVEQWLFAKYGPMHGAGDDLPFDLKYMRSGPEGHVIDHVSIFRAPQSAAVIAHARDGELIARAGIEPGTPFAIEGSGLELTIAAFYENANVNQKFGEVGEGPGYPAVELFRDPAVELAIGSSGKQTERLVVETPIDIPGYRLMYIQDERIKDFYSVLQITDGDEVLAEKKIEVNDPLRYQGYALYQSDWDSNDLTVSGLEVRKDPGVPLVYAGFLVQLLGMIVIFYINPLIRKAKKSKA